MPEHLVRLKSVHDKDLSKKRNLQLFAADVEDALNRARGKDAAVKIVCRLMTHKDQRIAALMTIKWVEWRFGKPKDPDGAGAQGFAIQIVNHIPRPGEAIAGESSSESNETSETKIIQAEPKSKQ